MAEITAARIERALNGVAEIIAGRPEPEGRVLLPIYKRLKSELEVLQAEDALMEEIRERACLLKKRRRRKNTTL